MRKRIRNNFVCSSKAGGNVVKMDIRELEKQVEWGRTAIDATSNPRRKAQMGLRLGQLCLDAGHPVLAADVWSDTLSQVRSANWDWDDEPINTRYYSLEGVFAYSEEEELGRRIDSVMRQIGHPEQCFHGQLAEQDFRSTWLWKYGEPFWE